MASVAEVSRLVDDILTAARPAAEQESAELLQFARRVSGNGTLTLQLWDVELYADALREARFNVSADTLREYLPLPAVRSTLFEVRYCSGCAIAQHSAQLSACHTCDTIINR
jgi:oligopeptidase A